MDFIRRVVSLAVPSRDGDCMDVSRGLRPRWIFRTPVAKRAPIPGVAHCCVFVCSLLGQPCRSGCEQQRTLSILRNGHPGIRHSLLCFPTDSSMLANRRTPVDESHDSLSTIAASNSRAWEEL